MLPALFAVLTVKMYPKEHNYNPIENIILDFLQFRYIK